MSEDQGLRRAEVGFLLSHSSPDVTQDSRGKYLVRYWNEKCRATPTTPLRSAIAGGMLKCLPLHEIVPIIISEGRPDERFREKVLAHLKDEAIRSPLVVYQSVVAKLLAMAPSLPHSRCATVAYFLEHLYGWLPCFAQQEIVRLFLDSAKPSMRNRGYRLLRTDWDASWQPEIERLWTQWHEHGSAMVIVDHFDPTFLIEHMDQLAEDLPDGRSIARLYLRACEWEPRVLEQLSRLDGITYAYVSARLSKAISTPAARKLLRQYRLDDRLGVLAWSLGKLGYWSLLMELADDVESIEDELREQRLRELRTTLPSSGTEHLEPHSNVHPGVNAAPAGDSAVALVVGDPHA